MGNVEIINLLDIYSTVTCVVTTVRAEPAAIGDAETRFGLLFNEFRELIVLGQSGRRVKIITDVHLVHRVVQLYPLHGQCAVFKRWFTYFSTGHRNRHDKRRSGGEPWHHRAVRV
jgi:hypothetical protein